VYNADAEDSFGGVAWLGRDSGLELSDRELNTHLIYKLD
jgi:hypothetical protein